MRYSQNESGLNQRAAQADDAAGSAQTVLANGPVSSVNGLTGIITFGMSELPGLVAALGGKATSSHGHAIADVSDLQTALNAKADASDLTVIDGGIY